MKRITRKQPRALSPTERRAEIAKQVKLRDTTIGYVLRHNFGISYSHFRCLLQGTRTPSKAVAERICRFVGVTTYEFWGVDQFQSPRGKQGNASDERAPRP